MSEEPYQRESTLALDILSASPLFGRLDRAARAEIADDLTFVVLATGEALFRQDDPGDSMYIVESGLLEVRVRDRDGTERILDRLDAGAGVGEMALLSGRPRSADVIAVVDSRLLRIDKAGFDRLAERHPAMASGFALAVAPRVQRLQLASVLTRLFGDLDAAALQTLQQQLEWRRLADGEVLFRQGELGTSMFIVVNGRLQVVLEPDSHGGRETVLGEIAAGETAGEYALLTDDIRSATLYATRDTDVVELTRSAFEVLLKAHPQLIMEIARIIVLRQKRALRHAPNESDALTVAIFPAGQAGAPLYAFAQDLAEILTSYGPTAVFTSESFDSAYGKAGAAQTEPDDPLSPILNAWLQQQEHNYRHILFVADPDWSQWSRRCLAQSDRVLLVGMAGSAPALGQMESYCNPRTRKELVLLHSPETAAPRGTLAWLEPRDGATHIAHHHVRQGDPAHWQRLARRLTGRTVGAAFSGGAARGLAHAGVIRALEEGGLSADYIGGASMGAFVGAMWAAGYGPHNADSIAAQMGNREALLDRTLPYTSVMASHKLTAVLRELFGDRQIEDLWRPYFCVSTNLSLAEPVIHERGPLWRAVRASVALPAVFSPILNERNELLVDGGLMNNFPVDVLASRYEFGVLIGSNVSPHRDRPYPHAFGDGVSGWQVLWSRANPFAQSMHAPTLAAIILRSVEVNSLYRRKSVEPLVDILIEPDVREFNSLEFEAYATLEQRGYEAGLKALQEYERRKTNAA